MGARVYLPTLGRFLQVDPVEGGTLNPYVYAHDPVNMNDYSGMFINLNKIKQINNNFRFVTKALNKVKSAGRSILSFAKNNPADTMSLVPGIGLPFDIYNTKRC